MRNRWVVRGDKHASGASGKSSLGRLAAEHPAAALVLGGLLFGAFSTAWMLLQTPNFLSGYDFVRMHAFYRAFYREALLSGRMPLWNPYVGLGRPFLADIETETLYPPNLLVLPFGVYGGTALLLILHQALAFCGGERLGRVLGASAGPSLLIGAGIALASPFTARLASGALPVYFSLCWWPVLLWLGVRLQQGWSRRAAAALSGAVAFAILAGNPPILFVEALGLFTFLLCRLDWRADWRMNLKNHAGLALAAIVGGGLAAVQILPFAELVGQGNRPLHADAFAMANGMPPASWLSLIFPTSTAFGPNWEFDLYCGMVPLFAAFGGILLWRNRNVRALLGLGLAGALLAAGDRAPFLGWILHIVPGASALRLPSRYGIWFATSLLGLAAMDLSRRNSRPLLPLLACFAMSSWWIIWLRPYVLRGQGEAAPYFLSHISPLAGSALVVAFWHCRGRWPRLAGIAGCALGVVCAGDWLWSIHLQSPVYSLYGYKTEEKAVRADLEGAGLLAPCTPPPRISFNPGVLCEDSGMVVGFSTYNSYTNPSLSRVWYYLHVATGLSASLTDFIRLPETVDKRRDRLDSINLVGHLDRGDRSFAIHPATDPRAYLAFDFERVPDWQAAEDKMASGTPFHQRAILEDGMVGAFAPDHTPHAGHVEFTAFDPERISLRTQTDGPAILVVGEAWYPGWRATAGGKDTAVFPVNGWMRGVALPGGDSEVVFSYQPRSLALGFWVSLLSAGALVSLLFFGPALFSASRGPNRTAVDRFAS